MQFLVLDFETKDPYIGWDLGGGWVYEYNMPGQSQFKTIGFSYSVFFTSIDGPLSARYIRTDEPGIELLKLIVRESDHIIMHNAQYDIGCLLALGFSKDDLALKKFYDTKIIAYLYDSSLMSYSLDPLSKKYLPEEMQKKKGSLVDVVIQHNLLAPPKKKNYNVERYRGLCEKYAYQNMDKLQEVDFDSVAYYANQDVIATGELFKLFSKHIPLAEMEYWSRFQFICACIRSRGIAVDMDELRASIDAIRPDVEALLAKLKQHADINWSAPKQVATFLLAKGYKLAKTDKGGDSINRKSLVRYKNDPLIELVLEYKEVNKIYKDFFVKVLNLMIHTCPAAYVGDTNVGKIYPEFNVFGARTGRFSSSNPNIQQQPKRNEKYGKLVRNLFICNDSNKKWYSLDWSNQEGRLQVHYAALLGAPGVSKLVQAYKENPKLDQHSFVADIVGVERKAAKAINLGLSYGMGQAKLCHELGLTTELKTIDGKKVELAGKEGKEIIDKYNKYMPYLKKLSDYCKKKMKERGHIYTIRKRKLVDDNMPHKALNKLIQGSAADQCLMALRMAFDSGLDVICIVHDEFNIEGDIEAAKTMQEIMQTVLDLKIPMVAEISEGTSWGNIKNIS